MIYIFFLINDLFVYQKLSCDQWLPKTKNKSLLLILTKIYFDTYWKVATFMIIFLCIIENLHGSYIKLKINRTKAIEAMVMSIICYN